MILTMRQLVKEIGLPQTDAWFHIFKIWIYAIEDELSTRIEDVDRCEHLQQQIMVHYNALPSQAQKNRVAGIFQVRLSHVHNYPTIDHFILH
jgi:hypothetical protein